jgi:hypothetical protein
MMLLLVTLTSMLLAAIMSVVAWRSSREERRRSDARIALLAADIHGEPAAPAAVVEATGDLFAPEPSAPRGLRFAAVAGCGLLVCGSAAALAVVSSNASSDAPNHPASRASIAERQTGASNAAVPIELLALGYEREGDQLIVKGVVRNPSAGAPLDRVTAVVLLFKEDGGFLTSGRTALDPSSLGPGGETAFAVVVPGASGVGHYRVSFRMDDHVVPHIDRRSRT